MPISAVATRESVPSRDLIRASEFLPSGELRSEQRGTERKRGDVILIVVSVLNLHGGEQTAQKGEAWLSLG